MHKNLYNPYKDYHGMIAKEDVKRLSQLNPAIPIRDTFLCWALIIGIWTSVVVIDSWFFTPFATLFIGIIYYSLFIVGHDGMHLRLFSNHKTNNSFCDWFILAPIGAITRINKQNHMTHHKYLSTHLDPDIYKHSCHGKDTTGNFLFFLTGFQKIYESLIHVYLNKGDKTKESKSMYSIRDLALLVGWQVLLFASLTYFIGWWAYVVLWGIPVYISILLDNIRSFSEHSHDEPDHLADQHRLITFLPNPIEKLIFAPLNMHHHVAHHLWPSIPYYNLAKATELIKKHEKASDLEWRTSYISYLFTWFKKTPITNCKHA